MLKIALVHDWLTGMRGGEKCLAEAARHWPKAPLATLLHVRGRVEPEIELRPVTTSWLNRLPGVDRYYRALLPLMPAAIERLRLPDEADCVLSFSHAVAKGVRPPAGVPHVCYCFTPMRYAWHLREEYVCRERRSPVGAIEHRLLDRLRTWDRAASERVTQFVACSRAVARRIEEAYGRASVVIYPPVDTHYYTPADVSREDYYLCVSALVPYKRIELAIDACATTGRRLVVIGRGPAAKRLRERACGRVDFLGWCDDATIRYHLRRCRALIFPGREDFGIVPVEAQACGAPVVALGADGALETVLPASQREVGTGVLFGEPSTTALVAALDELESGRAQLSAKLARHQAEQFAPERYIEQLSALVEQVVADRRAAHGSSQTSLAGPHRGIGPRLDQSQRIGLG